MNCRAEVSGIDLNPDVTRDIQRIQQIWNECRGRYGDHGPWLFGEFGVADAMFAPVVLRFATYRLRWTACRGSIWRRSFQH